MAMKVLYQFKLSTYFKITLCYIAYIEHVSNNAQGGGPQPLSIKSTRNVCRKFLEIYDMFIVNKDSEKFVFLNWLVIGCGYCEEAFCAVR
jgi:hypothetical protein